MPASLRVALISAISHQDYTVFDSLYRWEGCTAFYLTFPSMIALTNRPKVWVTAMYVHLNYIFRDQGNEYLSSQTQWTLPLAKTPFITWLLYALTLAQNP